MPPAQRGQLLAGCALIPARSEQARHFAGADGALLITAGGSIFPAPRVDVIDTTGAGDAFVGGLLFALSAQIAGIMPSLAEAISNVQCLRRYGDDGKAQ